MHFRDERAAAAAVRAFQQHRCAMPFAVDDKVRVVKLTRMQQIAPKKHGAQRCILALTRMIRALNLPCPRAHVTLEVSFNRTEFSTLLCYICKFTVTYGLTLLHLVCIIFHVLVSRLLNHFLSPCYVVAKIISRRRVFFDQTVRRTLRSHAELEAGLEKCYTGLARDDPD